MASSDIKRSYRPVFLATLIVTVIFLVASYFFSMLLGLASFFFTPEGLDVGAVRLQYVPILLFYLPVSIPIQPSVGMVFLAFWIVYAVSFAAAWKFRESFHGVLREAPSRSTKKLFSNCLFTLPFAASMTLIVVVVIHAIQESFGILPGQPPLPENPFETFFLLSYAPLVEEIGFRVCPIGVFLIAYLFSARRERVVALPLSQRLKLLVLTVLFPDKAKRMVGIKTVNDFGVREGISLGEWIMVILTALIFGLLHYLNGGGWQVGKISSTTVQGLVLAFTYLLYGVQAPILLHWFFNYHFTAFELASDLHPNLFPAYLVVQMVTLVLGMLGCAAVTILGIRRIVAAIARRTRPTTDRKLNLTT